MKGHRMSSNLDSVKVERAPWILVLENFCTLRLLVSGDAG